MAKATDEIKRIVARYAANLRALGVPVERIYLFGSQARRDSGTDSDVDLAVVSPLFEKMSLWERAGYLGRAAWDIERRWMSWGLPRRRSERPSRAPC